MRMPEEIILKPVITERSTMESSLGKYTFRVDKNATKTQIRKAAEKLFKVKVLKVNTSNYEGKAKRQGVHVGKTASWKKAVITIDTDPKATEYLAKGGKKTSTARKYKDTIEEFGFSG